MEMNSSNLRGTLKLAQHMGKASELILQTLFSTAIEQLAGLSLDCGTGLSMTATKHWAYNLIMQKPFFEELPQIARYNSKSLACNFLSYIHIYVYSKKEKQFQCTAINS